MDHVVRIIEISNVTHNVKRLRIEKPEGYKFVPGQATDVALDQDGWRDEQRPFTFTSLNEWPELEFTIKIYPDHNGVTKRIGELKPNDRIIIDDPWGAIRYRGTGCFIAGGAGVTPFIAIIRDLAEKGELSGNRLIFSNKTEKDIILKSEFDMAKGLDCLYTVTEEDQSPLAQGMIDREFLAKHISDFDQPFYVCGPDKMVEDISAHLKELGANPDAITFEE